MMPVRYLTAEVDGLKVFYRKSGPTDAPKLLLLHGFPSAGHMFRNLIPLLADRFHIVAPDLPGFGQSDMPSRESFRYLFHSSIFVHSRHAPQSLSRLLGSRFAPRRRGAHHLRPGPDQWRRRDPARHRCKARRRRQSRPPSAPHRAIRLRRPLQAAPRRLHCRR